LFGKTLTYPLSIGNVLLDPPSVNGFYELVRQVFSQHLLWLNEVNVVFQSGAISFMKKNGTAHFATSQTFGAQNP